MPQVTLTPVFTMQQLHMACEAAFMARLEYERRAKIAVKAATKQRNDKLANEMWRLGRDIQTAMRLLVKTRDLQKPVAPASKPATPILRLVATQ